MSQTALSAPTVSAALLCMGPGVDALKPPPAMATVNGMALIYHQAKQLQRLGIIDITIAVETVPPELPLLVEQMQREGIRAQLIRNITDMLVSGDPKAAVLIRSTDMWVNDDVLRDLASARVNSIAIVQEHPDNKGFERIDLNRRWAGLAVLDGSILSRAADIAEGWSLDSCLLRHALQAGANEIALTQDVVATGALRKFDGVGHLAALGVSLLSGATHGSSIEGFVARMGRKLLPMIWPKPALKSLVEWSFPGLAAVAAAFGFAGFATVALAVGVVAILAAIVRDQLRHAEYRGSQKDRVAAIAFTLLAIALAAALFQSGSTKFDAIFIAFALSGLVGVSQSGLPEKWLREFSPVLAGLLLLAASLGGVLAPVAKLAILVVVGSLAWVHMGRRSHSQS